jgi:hypothetical protein
LQPQCVKNLRLPDIADDPLDSFLDPRCISVPVKQFLNLNPWVLTVVDT